MNALALYAYEENLAGLFTAGLLTLGLNAPNLNSLPEFQKARPRAEVFAHGFAAHAPVQLALIANLRRITAYRGSLVLTCVTASDTGGKASHSSYRAQVRASMDLDVIRSAINQAAQVSGTAAPVNSTTASFTTGSPHGFTSGQLVTVESSVASLSATSVITVTSPTVFDYAATNPFGTDNSAKAALVVPYALQWIVPSGSSLTTKYQEGYESSKLTYQVEFSIQKNAWAFLTAE